MLLDEVSAPCIMTFLWYSPCRRQNCSYSLCCLVVIGRQLVEFVTIREIFYWSAREIVLHHSLKMHVEEKKTTLNGTNWQPHTYQTVSITRLKGYDFFSALHHQKLLQPPFCTLSKWLGQSGVSSSQHFGHLWLILQATNYRCTS